MKFPKILSGTILTLALAASFDAAFTSCSCSTSNIPEGWPKQWDIHGDNNVKINWSFPKKNQPLYIHYETLNGYKNVRVGGYNKAHELDDRTYFLESSMKIDKTNKIIEVPYYYIWSNSNFPYDNLEIGVDGLYE